MKTTKKLLSGLPMLGIGLAFLTCQTDAASTGAGRSTLQLQTRSAMQGAGSAAGAEGWATSRYTQHGQTANQALQISLKRLPANQVFHLMASQGTNGELIHLSDFMPNRSGAILMQYLAGSPHHFAGTDNPGMDWRTMGGWTNHMSWVLFSNSGTNWCQGVNGQGPHPSAVIEGMGGSGGMGDPGQGAGAGPQGMGGQNGGPGGMGGGPGMGGFGGMGNGWPAMSDWRSSMNNWWSEMASWCWEYTNFWNPGVQYSAVSTDWWGSLGRGASHVMPMPASISGVLAINGLVVLDVNLMPVMSADLSSPDSFGYQTRLDFTNQGVVPGASAVLQANATQHGSRFTLSAEGLAPSTTYFMDINGTNVTPAPTDAHGRLRVRELPNGATSMRGVGRISILDRNHTPVLSATLPPD